MAYKLELLHGFNAAHSLKDPYSSECKNLHGHFWRVKVEINTNQLKNGMVVDFKKIKEIINSLDHKYLNDILSFDPTAENIAKYLYDLIFDELNPSVELESMNSLRQVKITIWEAENASITYEQ